MHKVQGLTLDEIVFDMKGGHFSPGQAYVACSRVKSIKGLHITNLNVTAIKKSVKVETEMHRLASKLIDYDPIPYIDDNVRNHDKRLLSTLCCLNVRSLSAKIDDITCKCDEFLQSVDVLCICETWLTESQATPNVIDDSTVIRCDRTCTSRGGGLMIICKKNVIHIYTPIANELSNNGIECINGTVLLCENFVIILSLVYRPPQVPMRSLLNTSSDVIENVDDDEPMIVLGDFNEDVMTNRKSVLIQFMQTNDSIIVYLM